jgi:hypothetical protein
MFADDERLKRVVTRAFRPLKPVVGGSIRSTLKPAEVPTDFPPDFPPSLRLRTGVILAEIVKEYPDRSKLEQLCRAIVSRVTKLLCEAVREGVLKGHAAPDRLNTLLHYVRVANCDNDNERFRVEGAVINSEEWHSMLKQLVDCENAEPKAARKSKPATWEEIEITFLSDHRVQIVAGDGRENANYNELGFEDARNGRPKAAWETLRMLAEGRGVLEYSGIQPKDLSNTEKRVQEIRAILRRKFGLVTDPVPNVKNTGYRTAFKIGVRPSFNS